MMVDLAECARVSGTRPQYLRVVAAEILVNLARPGVHHTCGESRVEQLKW